ncbi:ABC transporter [Aestuariimicrobium soli]|uniref:ABC transporter n=1 Tax=Aestuariimicrobium soli TaxID=2035834 RepID=UPI003EB92DB3
MGSQQLAAALTGLRSALVPVTLPIELPGVADHRRAARDLVHQLDDYVLPRLATIDAPLLAVVGGSTGAGKSTLVNSLVGRTVTTPGVIRPTTKSPVLIHHPDDEHWFDDERILPGLIRSRVSSHDQNSLKLVAEPSLPPGLAILDAPDIDSVEERNRVLAAQLLQAADLWLFVTSAARYADAVPWDFLKQAVERRAAVAVVLDRVPPAAMTEVPTHLGQMMTERGLADSPLFAVPETTTDADGLLPDSAVSPIRGWLAGLAADSRTRQQVVLQTLDGAITSMAGRVPALATAVDEQAEALASLRDDARSAYAEAARQVAVQSADGTLLRGEVLARWHELVGTGEFLRALDQKLSWLRDRVWGTIVGKPPEVDKMKVAVENGLEALVREEGEAAAERAEAAWRSTPAGRSLLARHATSHGREDLARASSDFPTKVARAIRDWQGDVIELVADEGMDKRSKARLLAFGVNGAGVALMVAIFAHTGGLTGAEIGVAGGTSVLAQRLLEGIIGDDAVRSLAERAKADLDQRIEALMATELARYEALLGELQTDEHQADALREAVDRVEQERASGYADERALTSGIDTAGELTAGLHEPVVTVQQVTGEAPDVVDAELVERGEER